MRVNRAYHAFIILIAMLVLSACGGGTQTPTPTPTLIVPEQPIVPEVVEDPTDTPTPTPAVTDTPTPTITPTPGQVTYRVVKGDWIYSIARQYGIDPRDILAANPGITNPDVIQPDIELVIPGQGPPTPVPTITLTPTITNTPVAPPTEGPASLPVVDPEVFQAMLAEELPAVDAATCDEAVVVRFESGWSRPEVGRRLGCPTAEALPISGTWLEFGPGSRIMWIRELLEFNALTGAGYGTRYVFTDNSGLLAGPAQPAPANSQNGYTPTQGRYAWLLGVHPEVQSIFLPAFGDENVIVGQYQEFENGAMLFDGALVIVFFNDSGPWWYLVP